MVEDAMARDPGLRARLERMIPMRRMGEAEEVSAAVAWLASPRSGFVTGQVISISGGVTMH
jgi:2-hydroxycyclohexanecarboxyl-CoA dehydrogenase